MCCCVTCVRDIETGLLVYLFVNMSSKSCCVPGCAESGQSHSVLHGFPNPDKYPDRFRSWTLAIGGDILGLNNSHIYTNRRVCHAHFEDKYHCRLNRISNIAVPTLNLPDRKNDKDKASGDSAPSEPNKSVGEKASTHREPPHQPHQRDVVKEQRNLDEPKFLRDIYIVTEISALGTPAQKLDIINIPETEQRIECTTESMDVYGDDEVYIADENALYSEAPEGPFSWLKDDTSIPCVDDEPAQVAPAAPADEVQFFVGDVTADCEDYRCNLCSDRIIGSRYTCLQCADFELCARCEAADRHAEHFVLRTPANAPHSQVVAVLSAARAALASNQVLLTEGVEIKSEAEDEAEDPMLSRPASQATSDHSTARPDRTLHESVDEESDSDRYSPGSDSGDSDDTEYSRDMEYKRKRKHRSAQNTEKVVKLTLEKSNEEIVLMSELQPVVTKTYPSHSSKRPREPCRVTDTVTVASTDVENLSRTQPGHRPGTYIVTKQHKVQEPGPSPSQVSLSTGSVGTQQISNTIPFHVTGRQRLVLTRTNTEGKITPPSNIPKLTFQRFGTVVPTSNVSILNKKIILPIQYTAVLPKKKGD